METTKESVRLVSQTFPRTSLARILREARPFTDEGHYLYPDDENGNHTRGFFAIDPVTRVRPFVEMIADDMAAWAQRVPIEADVLFAPAQPAVGPLAEALGARLHIPTAYWEYLPSGRYGDHLVQGSVPRGAKVLAANGVSLQGRCVGLRLPQFVESLGGAVVAAAVFAKGSTELVRQTEQRLGERFYSTLQVDVPIYPAAQCPMCASTRPNPISWRVFAEAPR
ncbi:MAG TPA: hypothetical protein VJP06_02555 [Thermoplasmata archaeon]|nr:hypothetical protein [Thermoplasmata archaeon]